MNWEQLGYSVAAILVLALVARWLRLGESRIVNVEQAERAAEDLLAGFVARGGADGALVGTDGGAALVAGTFGAGAPAGTVALLKRHGARIAARRLIAPLRLTQAVEGVRIESGERLFGAVLLFGVTDVEVRAFEATLASARATPMTIH